MNGITAAPNLSAIKAKVLNIEQSKDAPVKYILELEIIDSKSLEGPNFAHVGKRVEGFSFGISDRIIAGSIISAQAEYIGGPKSGKFRLTNVVPE